EDGIRDRNVTGVQTCALPISTHNPTVEEILSQDPDADILYIDDIVYATNIDWVDELALTKGEEIGEVEKNTTSSKEFINKTANEIGRASCRERKNIKREYERE